MTDVFDLKSEISDKDKIIKKFSEWWTEDEIKEIIIPDIVDAKIKDSVNGALKNFDTVNTSDRKNFSEILYDFVRQNFLVNHDKFIRIKFLEKILKKRYSEDKSFEKRFSEFLIQKRNSNWVDTCKFCKKRWMINDTIYIQKLGLDNAIYCSDYQCVLTQQKNQIKTLSDPYLIDFLMKFKLQKEYRFLCRKLIDEFNFPESVVSNPSSEMKLLPETVSPLGEFSYLYDYQSSIGLQIIDMLEHYQIETSRGLVVLPTGAGKTRLVVETLINWLNNGKKGKEKSNFIIWIVDKNELCQQAFDTFAEVFRHIGKKDSSLKLHPIYAENQKNIRDILYQYSIDENDREIKDENGIIIASIASLYSLSKNDDQGSLPELGKHTSIVIIDEAHHAIPSNISYTQVLRALGFDFRNVMKKGVDISENQTRLLGLTATPFRGTEELGKTTIDLLNRFGGMGRILWPPFSENIQTENKVPFAHLDVQKSAYQEEHVKIYGERSYDRDGKINTYRFKISNLLTTDNFTSNPIIHDKSYFEKNIEWVFDNPGRYTIELIVTDDEGFESTNLAISNIEILPKIEREKKNNVEEMKKLYKYLIKREILAKPHHYIIDNSKIQINLDNEKDIKRFERFHDISDAKISEMGNDPFRNKKIIDKIISLVKSEKRKSILLFSCSIQHAKLISFILDAIYGIKSASIDHTTSIEERNQSIHDFRNGKISVLCNYDILTTGFDSPKVECVFITRPTFSHLLYNQMAGRGLRGPRSNGTSNCIIVDISDNIQLVTQDGPIEQPWKIFDYIYETTYDERKEKESDQKCYGCFGIGQKNIAHIFEKCEICNGSGKILTQKTENEPHVVEKDPGKYQKYLMKAKMEHPHFNLEQLKLDATKKMEYDRILALKNDPPLTGEWTTTCQNCGKTSNDMTLTLVKFGTSEELRDEKNPKGVFKICKECRNKDSDFINSKRLDYTKCPKCGKIAHGLEQIEKIFGFRMVNNKKTVQSWCFECR